MAAPRSVFASARLFALGTVASRVTGLVRDMLLTQVFGLTRLNDAFTFAFQLPNLARRLFGEGALAAAFVPVFARAIEQERESAWSLLARVLALLSVCLTGLLLLAYAVLAVVWWTAGDVADNRLLVTLTAIMLPFLLTICIVALLSSVLNCVHSFVPGALMPIVLNFAMILAIIASGPLLGDDHRPRIVIVAWSVLAAGVLQLLMLAPVLRANGIRLGWRLDARDPQVRRIIRNMGPVLLGQGVLVLGPFLDSLLCWSLTRPDEGPTPGTWLGLPLTPPLEAGAITALANAQRLYQFPLGVLGIALATAALPQLSRLAAAADRRGWTAEFTRTFRMAVFLGLLTGVMMIVWGAPIVRLLFEYRNFEPASTPRVAWVMQWYGLGLWAFFAQHIVVRGFYSLGDIRTPLRLSCIMLPLALAISLALVWTPLGAGAFALASSISATLTVAVGLALLRGRAAPGLLQPDLARALLAMLVCAAGAAGGVVLFDWLDLADQLAFGPVWLARLVHTTAGLTLGTAAFLTLARLLKLPEAGAVLALRRR